MSKFSLKKPITTSGSGYIPEADMVEAIKNEALNYAYGNLPADTIRHRLYNNLIPRGYYNALQRVHDAVVENKQETGKDSFLEPRDDIFAEYLQIPKTERNLRPSSYRLYTSAYKPKNAEKDNYFGLNLHSNDRDKLYEAIYHRKVGLFNKNKPLKVGENAVAHYLLEPLGNHTIGRGKDEKGEYMSYYDLWDVAPFTNKGDESQGIGKPVPIYDRIYLDDYFDLPQEGATYLPEILVQANKSK